MAEILVTRFRIAHVVMQVPKRLRRSNPSAAVSFNLSLEAAETSPREEIYCRRWRLERKRMNSSMNEQIFGLEDSLHTSSIHYKDFCVI